MRHDIEGISVEPSHQALLEAVAKTDLRLGARRATWRTGKPNLAKRRGSKRRPRRPPLEARSKVPGTA